MDSMRAVVFLAVLLTVSSETQLCIHSFALRHLKCTGCKPVVNVACSNGEFLSLTQVKESVKRYTFDHLVLETSFRMEIGTLICEISDSMKFLGRFGVKRSDFTRNMFVGDMTDAYTFQLELCQPSKMAIAAALPKPANKPEHSKRSVVQALPAKAPLKPKLTVAEASQKMDSKKGSPSIPKVLPTTEFEMAPPSDAKAIPKTDSRESTPSVVRVLSKKVSEMVSPSVAKAIPTTDSKESPPSVPTLLPPPDFEMVLPSAAKAIPKTVSELASPSVAKAIPKTVSELASPSVAKAIPKTASELASPSVAKAIPKKESLKLSLAEDIESVMGNVGKPADPAPVVGNIREVAGRKGGPIVGNVRREVASHKRDPLVGSARREAVGHVGNVVVGNMRGKTIPNERDPIVGKVRREAVGHVGNVAVGNMRGDASSKKRDQVVGNVRMEVAGHEGDSIVGNTRRELAGYKRDVVFGSKRGRFRGRKQVGGLQI